MSTPNVTPNIKGLPEGAIVKPLASTPPQPTGLPPGAVVRSLISAPPAAPNDTTGAQGTGRMMDGGAAMVNNGTTEGLAQGIGAGVGESVSTVGHLINKIPLVGEDLSPSSGLAALDANNEQNSRTFTQKVGKGAETIAEFMLGDEALKGLSYAQKLKRVAPALEHIDKFPKIKAMLETAIRQGTVGTGDALLHGATPKEALGQGAAAGGLGGLMEGGGMAIKEALKKVRPGVTSIAGEEMPVLASQKKGAPAVAHATASIGTEPEIAAAQQKGSQQAISNIAAEAADSSVKRMNAGIPTPEADTAHLKDALEEIAPGKKFGELAPSDMSKVASRAQELKDEAASTAKEALRGKVSSFGDAAEHVRDQAKPIFAKIDEASGGEFSKLRKARSNAYKTGNFDKVKEADAAIDALFDGSTKEVPSSIVDAGGKPMSSTVTKQALEGVDKGDLARARKAWVDSKVLDNIHSAVEGSFNGVTEDAAARTGVNRGIRGGSLQQRLGGLLKKQGVADIERVIGKEGIDNLYRISELTSTPQRAAQFGDVARNVAKFLGRKSVATTLGAAAGHYTGIGAYSGAAVGAGLDEAARAVMHKAAINPRVGKMVENAIKVGASPRVYSALIAQAMREIQEKQKANPEPEE